MALDRTWYNTLVDDDGSGLTGSVWDKADVDSLMDAIDAEFARLHPAAGVIGCILSNSIAQPFGSGVWANMPWGSELYDPHGMHAPNDSLVTFPAAGVYRCNAVIPWEPNVTGVRYLTFIHNAAVAFPNPGLPSEMPAANGSLIQKLNACVVVTAAGQYVAVQMHQTSGITLTFAANGARFEVFKIG